MKYTDLNIAGFEVGNGRALVIAEIGNNHNGNFDLAIEMIDQAKAAGADCVKFQMRHLSSVYRARSLLKNGDDLGTEYVVDLLRRFELNADDHYRLAAYCVATGIPYLCTPWDLKSIDLLEDIGVPAYKVASADLTNFPLVKKLAGTSKPLILSTGMSLVEEIKATSDLLNTLDSQFILLHCNSTYPAPLQDINLRWMASLKEMHGLIGYSGHERGINVSLAAIALGACVIERHFTLDREMEGPDHAASLLPEEFSAMVTGIREIEIALGSNGTRVMSQGEMINRENLGKSLVAATSLSAGTILESKHIKVCSPGQGLSPQKIDSLLGQKLLNHKKVEDFFFLSDVIGQEIVARPYRFRRPWGIPVRYHDFEEYSAHVKPDFWEFHLSYSDMDLDPTHYIASPQGNLLVVHAPELYSRSRLMDLATPDERYRMESICETQRVIDITRQLKRIFPASGRPLIVANIGGFSLDSPLKPALLKGYYERFADSITRLDLEGVELIPQTMAPFPWHFGGQRFQNLFITHDDIIYWCEKLGLRMCFDISHSKLACNHLNIDFYKFAELIAPFTAHLHFGDAIGVNGEGIQIGEGDIDFVRLSDILNKLCPDASFIPEIWQGHKNGGEGFWHALDQLEGLI